MKRQFSKCISLVLAFLLLFTSVYTGPTVYADEGLYLVESEYESPEYYPEDPEDEVTADEVTTEEVITEENEYLAEPEYGYPEYYPEYPEDEVTTDEEVITEENEYLTEPEYGYPEYYPEYPKDEVTTDEEVTTEEVITEENEYLAEPEYGYPEYYPEYPEDEVITDEYLVEEYEHQEAPNFTRTIQPLIAGAETLYVDHVCTGNLIDYSSNVGTGRVFQVTANGNTSFCIESGIDDRRYPQTYRGRFLERAGNELLFKSLYYLYEGPGWEEFRPIFERNLPGATTDQACAAYAYSRLVIIEAIDRLNSNILDVVRDGTVSAQEVRYLNPHLREGIDTILNIIAQQPMPHDGFRVFVYGEYSVVEDDEQAYVSWEDQRGIIRVRKYDPDPSMSVHPIEGAVFTVRNANNVVVDTIITGADGHGQSRILPFGTYTVTETQAPYGFILNPVSETVTLSRPARTGEIVYSTVISIPNRSATGNVRVNKTGEVLVGADRAENAIPVYDVMLDQYTPRFEERPLADGVFEVRVRNPITTNDGTTWPRGHLVDTITTDSNGIAESRQLPLGDYFIVERVAPFGMILDPTERDFTLSYAGQEIPIVIAQKGVYNERQRAEVSLVKRFNIPNRPPAGFSVTATFGLFARENIFAVDGSLAIPQDGLIRTVTVTATGANPVTAAFDVDLPFGEFYIEELAVSATAPHRYWLDSTQYDLIFEYTDPTIAKVYLVANDGNPILNELAGSMRISKDIRRAFNFEYATGAGIPMTTLGFTSGQQWPEFTPINMGAVRNGTFAADIIIQITRYVGGRMTAVIEPNGDLTIHYATLDGYHLQQSARLDIVSHPSHFTSKEFGDLMFRSTNRNYSGAARGYITIPSSVLIQRGIDVNNNDQNFYVFLRLDRVAGGIMNQVNRSWYDANFEYEFMIFNFDDFRDPVTGAWVGDFINRNDAENAVELDVPRVLRNGIRPMNITVVRDGNGNTIINPAKRNCELCIVRINTRTYCTDANCNPASNTCLSVFVRRGEYVEFDLLPGRYFVAEVFRNPDGSIITNPDFVNIIGLSSGAFNVNEGRRTDVRVTNQFFNFFDDVNIRKP